MTTQVGHFNAAYFRVFSRFYLRSAPFHNPFPSAQSADPSAGLTSALPPGGFIASCYVGTRGSIFVNQSQLPE
jgi:hypothetical protein